MPAKKGILACAAAQVDVDASADARAVEFAGRHLHRGFGARGVELGFGDQVEPHRRWPALAQRLQKAGWSKVAWRNLTGGIVTLHRGFKA